MKRYLIVILLAFVVISCNKPLNYPVRHVDYPPCAYFPTGKMVIVDAGLRSHYDYFGWCGRLLYVSRYARPLPYNQMYSQYYNAIADRVRWYGYAVISFTNGWGGQPPIVIYQE